MAVTYYKRFRMEIDLKKARLPEAALPEEYRWVAWHETLLERHALAKFESFRSEIDSEIFPSLADPASCRCLMSEIVQRATFVPQATWLIECVLGAGSPLKKGTVPLGDIDLSRRDHLLERDSPLFQQAAEVTEDCGTIQGLIQAGEWGAIQNVGIAAEHRGRGLGKALVLKSLAGFQTAGVPRVYLEVTARNAVAVQLYRSIGFRLARTTYKAVDRPTAMFAVL